MDSIRVYALLRYLDDKPHGYDSRCECDENSRVAYCEKRAP